MDSIKLKYLRVEQRGLPLYLTKANALQLKSMVDFHFREPYSDTTRYISQDFVSLRRSLEKNDVSFADPSEGIGVQRALKRDRVYEIKDFIENDPSAILPSTVLLAIDTSQVDTEIPVLDETGIFELTASMHASIIDGQHRLAGLFLADDGVLREIEIPIVFLLNIDTPTAARLFQQINGKQQKVNKSIIFDLFDNIEMDSLTDEDDRMTKEYHTICKNMYMDSSSPLFRQIKMLGIGGGAISQSFFIETCKRELKFMNQWDIQDKYDVLYSYFQMFQRLFPEDWPVPIESENMTPYELEAHSEKVLRKRRSQLMKTNGFGAIIKLLRYMYDNDIPMSGLDALKGNVDWVHIDGTGDKAQKALFDKLQTIVRYPN